MVGKVKRELLQLKGEITKVQGLMEIVLKLETEILKEVGNLMKKIYKLILICEIKLNLLLIFIN